jgi:hypothetical protein
VKRTELAKLKGKKVDIRMNQAGTPGRFGKAAAEVPDRREQRKRDQALGLVPFAVKLDGELVQRLHALAQQRETGLNELVGELLTKGLGKK